MLTLQIKEKEIENLTPEEEFVRGTVGAKCQINFDEFWQSYNKYIVFKRVGYEPINFMVDTLENENEIPYTILAESGEFKIGVFGTTETEILPTLYSKDIKILYGTDTHGTTPPTYIPSEIDQLRLSKQDKLTAGNGIKIENNVISATGGGGSGGTTNYELLENKPQINGIELLGNKSLTDLGIDIPTKTSELENDSGFIDDTAFENYYTKTEVDEKTVVDQTYNKNSQNAQSGIAVAEALSGYVVAEVGKGLSSNDFTNEDKEKLYSALQNENIDKTYTPTSPNAQSGTAVAEAVSDKQDSLVSGTNIKTINNQSILGSGNITIEGGSDVEVDQNYNPTSENAQSGKAVAEAVEIKADKENFELIENITVNEEAIVSRTYADKYKKILVIALCEDNLPKFRLTADNGMYFWEFYGYDNFSKSRIYVFGEIVIPNVFQNVYTIFGSGGGNGVLQPAIVDRYRNSTSYFDGFKTNDACKVGTTIKVYGVKL